MLNLPKPVILKIVSLIVLFMVTVIGCNAHFKSTYKTVVLEEKDYQQFCDLSEQKPTDSRFHKCPSVLPMERTFAAFTIIFLILTMFSLIASFILDMSRFRVHDAVLYVVAGILLLISGILLVVAATRINGFVDYFVAWETDLKELKGTKHHDKVAAGIIGVICAILHAVTAGYILNEAK